MKEILNELRGKDYDAYFFYAGDEDGKVMIQSSTYKETGTKIGGNEIGDCYHIVLFRMDEEGKTFRDINVGDWVCFRPSDGFPVTLNPAGKAMSNDSVACRIVSDLHIRMRVSSPDTVY